MQVRPTQIFGYRLGMVSAAWKRRFEAELTSIDLTHTQFVILAKAAWLQHEGERPTQTRIADMAHADRMMVSKIVRLLEEKGFMNRCQHPEDPRANQVLVTDSGRALLVRACPLVLKAQEEFFGSLGEQGKADLARLLDQLIATEAATAGGS